MPHKTHKYQIPPNTAKYRQIPPNTAKYRQIPPNTAKYRQIPPNTAKYRQIPPNTAKYRQIPPNTAKYRQIPPNTAKYRRCGTNSDNPPYLEDVKLDKVIKLCRVASEARAQSDMLNESTGVNRVSCMSISSENQNTVHRAERTSVKRGNHTSAKTYKCTKYCDTNHLAGECPAFHHRCKECQRTGHYESCCWRKKKGINVIRAEAEEKPVGPLTDLFSVKMVKETDTDIDWKFTTLVT